MPEPTAKPVSKPPHPLTKLCAAHLPVVVQQKGGNIVRGRAKWYRSGYLKLEPATITGKNQTVSVPWVLIENQSIAHLHPDVVGEDNTATAEFPSHMVTEGE